MAINKASSIIRKLSYLVLLGYLQLLVVCGNELYMRGIMTSTNEVKRLTTSDKPSFFKILSYGLSYYIQVSLGTPTQEVHLELDTGGAQPWIPCSNHQDSRQKWIGFHPIMSSSFQTIFCNSNLCKPFQLSWLTCNLDHPVPCDFSESYADGENEVGFLSQDVFAFGNHDMQIPNIAFGCIYKDIEKYRFDNGWITVGNIGLNPQSGSVFGQFRSIYGSYPIMSYCLASPNYDVEATSWMSFGGQSTKNLSFTPLVGPSEAPYFIVNLKGITIENVDVDLSNITTLTYDPISQVGGFILDTGSADTWLSEPLYSRFVNTFAATMKDKTGVDIDSYNNEDNDCYIFDSDIHASDFKSPNVTFHFDHGVHLHLKFENLFYNRYAIGIPTKDEQKFWCLAFQRTEENDEVVPYIIGNTLQQNFHVEIDYQHRKVGFGPLMCKSLKI